MGFPLSAGDSRAVLCRAKQAIRLTIDHKASLAEEAKRIRDAGGFIGRNKRVNGVLAISRALGDHMVTSTSTCEMSEWHSSIEWIAHDRRSCRLLPAPVTVM
jgi:serine/threonine protein phosphatase PrpC